MKNGNWPKGLTAPCGSHSTLRMILEKAIPDWKGRIKAARNYIEIATLFKVLFNLEIVPGQEPPKEPTEYKDENSDYGLKAKGIKAREQLNEQAREIIDRVKDPKDLIESLPLHKIYYLVTNESASLGIVVVVMCLVFHAYMRLAFC